MNAIVLTVLVLLATAPAMAAQGDCGQPVSSGPAPTASDCLFILRAAVGSETCGCICDVNGQASVSASDALVCLKRAVGQSVDLSCPCGFDRAGDETQINNYTAGDQRRPRIASDADGNLVVAWDSVGSPGTDTAETSVQVQRFFATGEPSGTQFQVNTFTTSYQTFPALAVSDDGAFVVAWSNSAATPSDPSNSVRARLFDSAGAPVANDFQVNTYTPSSQTVPSVAMDGAGNFVVVWQSDGSSATDTSGTSIQAQRYDSEGAALGTEFQVNTYTTENQNAPEVSAQPDGSFVVAWSSSKAPEDSYGSIQAQIFDSDGVAWGTQFTVNSYVTGAQSAPDVAFISGGFVVVWNSDQSASGDVESIHGQRFATALGDPPYARDGEEFQANGYTTSTQNVPAVAPFAGGFVVVWYSNGASGPDTGYSVQGQAFNAGGTLVGTEFQVNSYTTGYQVFADVARGSGGGFTVVWDSQGSDGTDSLGFSVRAQRFE